MDYTTYQNELLAATVLFSEVADQETLAAEMALVCQPVAMTEEEESDYHAYFGSK